MSNPTIGEMINESILKYWEIKSKPPTLLVLNRLAYVALLAFCVDFNKGAPLLGESGSKIETVANLYTYKDMDIAVLQEPTKADNGKYKVKVIVY